MVFEDEDYDPMWKDENYDTDDAEPVIYMGEPGVEIESKNDDDVIMEDEKDPYDRETVLKYITQVRNSFVSRFNPIRILWLIRMIDW